MEGEGLSASDKQPGQHRGRFRDGILWGALAVIPLFLANRFIAASGILVFAVIAGVRGKSWRPVAGMLATTFVIVLVLYIFIYIGISGINH